MTYATENGSSAMIYTQSFIKIGSGIQKLKGRIQRHTDRMQIA
jgi:Uri superfamily endonuclease